MALPALPALLAVPGHVMAAANQCNLPAETPVPHSFHPNAREPAQLSSIRAYTLAISWAPHFCSTQEGGGSSFDSRFECDVSANRFGFILHGLWPEGETGKAWLQYCRPAQILPPALIRANLCMTPSADMIQHEWAKHGTCGWRRPERYFSDARTLYERLNFPDMNALLERPNLTRAAFISAFVAVNPRIPANSVRLSVSREGWLQEIHLCLDKRRRFASCSNIDSRALDRTIRIRPIG